MGLKLPKNLALYGAGALAFLFLLSRRAGGTPNPDPDPVLDTYPFGIVLTSFGYSCSISATNYDTGEAGSNNTDVRIDNLGTEKIDTVLSFWTRPDGVFVPNALILYGVDPSGIRMRTKSVDANQLVNKGTWTVYSFGSPDRSITADNFRGKPMQFLDSDNFEVV